MWTYYLEVQSKEHMLMVSEISTEYGFKSNSGKPHPQLINAILAEYYEIQKKQIPVFIYPSKNMVRVFPSEIYHPAMVWFIQTIRKEGDCQYSFGHRVFNFTFVDKNGMLRSQQQSAIETF